MTSARANTRIPPMPSVTFLVESGVMNVVAISRDNWTFAERYVTGWELPGRLPVEELAFFALSGKPGRNGR